MGEVLDDGPLSDAERVRIQRRERRRRTPMVVDNAGVKRLRQALARQSKPGPGSKPPASG